jgi:hypothetical protein
LPLMESVARPHVLRPFRQQLTGRARNRRGAQIVNSCRFDDQKFCEREFQAGESGQSVT